MIGAYPVCSVAADAYPCAIYAGQCSVMRSHSDVVEVVQAVDAESLDLHAQVVGVAQTERYGERC
ncbi:hypothetical protein D3C78_1653710 [compost metagenome]